MNKNTRRIIVAGVAGAMLVVGSVAFAGVFNCKESDRNDDGHNSRTMGMMSSGHGPFNSRRSDVDVNAKASKHLQGLHKDLNLTSEQETQWRIFSNAVEQQAKRMNDAREDMHRATLTVPERIDNAEKNWKIRDQGMQEVGQAAKALYEVLSPEQRKFMDRRGPWNHG